MGRVVDLLSEAENPPASGSTSPATLAEAETRLRAAEAQLAELELQLDEAEARFRTTFENAPIGMAIVSVPPSPPGYVSVNRTLCEMLGRSPKELVGHSPAEFTHPDDSEAGRANLDSQRGTDRPFRREKRYLHADGRTIWVLLNGSLVRDRADKPLYGMAQMVDITERKEAEAKLAHQASHDPLTDLPNRRMLMERLTADLAGLTESDTREVALLFLDLDGFKSVNDTLGHDAGDELLVLVARRLRQSVRSDTTVARLGGDEFVMVSHVSGPAEATIVAERVEAAVSEPYQLFGRSLNVTVSIGVATTSDPACQPATLMRQADAAMYQAKEDARPPRWSSPLGQ